MTRIARLCLLAPVAALPPSFAFAHPGLDPAHGAAAGFAHPFGGFDHLLAMVGVGLWASQLGGRAVWALPLGFMAASALGGALGVIGAPLPLVEPGVMGSLVAIGLAVALARRVGTAVGFALVAAFALFHGHAHGTEMPAGASALGHAAGFLVATGLLHAVGVGMGLAAGALGRPVLTRGAGALIAAAGVVLVMGRGMLG